MLYSLTWPLPYLCYLNMIVRWHNFFIFIQSVQNNKSYGRNNCLRMKTIILKSGVPITSVPNICVTNPTPALSIYNLFLTVDYRLSTKVFASLLVVLIQTRLVDSDFNWRLDVYGIVQASKLFYACLRQISYIAKITCFN